MSADPDIQYDLTYKPRTNKDLIKLLEEAARKPFRQYTKYEAQEQRVSFIYGQLPKSSKLTKADIRTILNLSESGN